MVRTERLETRYLSATKASPL